MNVLSKFSLKCVSTESEKQGTRVVWMKKGIF